MAVIIDERQHTFTLQTRHSTYQMKVDTQGVLLHAYYGERTDGSDMSLLSYQADRGFSGNPYEMGKTDKSYSLDSLPQEYSCFGTGDYRITALKVQNEDGSFAAELRYDGYCLEQGKYRIPGLPAAYAGETEVQTLKIYLRDRYSGLKICLYYGIFEALDVITRTASISNQGNMDVVLQKAASMHLDFASGGFDWISFYGRHASEQNVQRVKLHHGVQSAGSVRGMSSHQYNPFLMLCEPGANETMGSCYGFSFLYSGEFLMELEVDQINRTRLICGIHPDNFAWNLRKGDTLFLPEAAMTYSGTGIGKASRNFHRLIQEHIIRGEWKEKRRPVLINNWEATYFDFTGEKLTAIAREAKRLGIELFVLDDGWFGKRDDDNTSLGDWTANEAKLGCTLKELAEQITAEGMLFGIWIEPEGVSEESNFYQTHPEWVVQIPGRKPCLGRNQLVLDFSRKEVQDEMLRQIGRLLSDVPISYVKWDMNRSICDKFSGGLSPDAQGEFSHRYVLGLYRVLEELHMKFPYVLFEGCAGGGGRFDAGMLYYTPQIWGSDNTDAVSRLNIQYGYSFGYPPSVIGSHVSAVPNHQTGRVTPLSARGVVAMAGTFGYELDVLHMTNEEKEVVKKQVQTYQNMHEMVRHGAYYRLTGPEQESCTVWEIADGNGRRALICAVYRCAQANPIPVRVKVQGLKEDGLYQMELEEECRKKCLGKKLPYGFGKGELVSGAALRHAGLIILPALEEFGAWQIWILERPA